MSNPYPNGMPDAAAFAWIANASNVKTGTNPAYTKAMFLEDFSCFTDLIPDAILAQFIAMATATVLEVRWRTSWRYGMGLFVAHFSTLYLQRNASGSSSTANQVINAAQARGLVTSESVGDVSISYDFSTISKGIEGWAMWNATSYGQEFATTAKMFGKGGMMIW